MSADWTYIVRDLDDFKKRGLSAWYAIITAPNGTDPYSGKTAEDYRSEGYTILTDEEFHTILTAADGALCDDWKEETKEQYNYALDVLPLRGWLNGGFYVPEPYTSNICSFHQKLNGKYYTSFQRTSTPRADILKSLTAWIESKSAESNEKERTK